MARSSIQRRQEAERARTEAYEASLRRVSQRARPAPDFELAIYEVQRGFERDVVRDAASWKPQMKTRDRGRLRLAAARHLFARYPVAEHLEQIWIDGGVADGDEARLRKRWYIAAASGGSVYREGASAWLSRKEVHAFLNPLGRVRFEEAIWQAIARTYTADPGVAQRIARSTIVQTPRGELPFWRDVCAYPTTSEEMDDLRDYLADCYRRNPEFNLKGRTPASLGRQMRTWHRDLAAVARIEAQRRRAFGLVPTTVAPDGGTWPGSSLSDWSWQPSDKSRRSDREVYLIVQLKTAADLVAETRAMHHCVASYASKCIAGHASIWSLRRRASGSTDRLLTIELDRQGKAIQIRGFANRLVTADERRILERWAKARGVVLPR